MSLAKITSTMQCLRILTVICLIGWTLGSNEDGLLNGISTVTSIPVDSGQDQVNGNPDESGAEGKCGDGDDSGLGFFGEDLDAVVNDIVDPVFPPFFSDEDDPGLEDAILWEDDCRLTSPFLGEDPCWVSTSCPLHLFSFLSLALIFGPCHVISILLIFLFSNCKRRVSLFFLHFSFWCRSREKNDVEEEDD